MDIPGLKDLPNCWEVMDCGEDTYSRCPAYPDLGKECWKVTGTLCAQGRFKMADLSEKILYCRNQCSFYREHASRIYP